MDFNGKYALEVKKTGNIKISIKCLTKLLDCSEEGRNLCGGFCCLHHNETLLPTYSEEELIELPLGTKKYVRNDGKVDYDEKGQCKLLQQCTEDGRYRPVECKLSPLGFNNTGRLILKRWCWLIPCPRYGKGEPVYKSMKSCLVEVFGQEIYDKIVSGIKNNKENL